jgi:hypothetical protein
MFGASDEPLEQADSLQLKSTADQEPVGGL